MNSIKYIAVLLLVSASGCVVTKPSEQLKPSTEFDAWVVDRSADSTSIRCELLRPPDIQVSDLWRHDTLEVQNGTNLLTYTIDGGSGDMLTMESETTRERFGLGILPFGTNRSGQRTSIRSQVLVRVGQTEGLTSLTIVYHGTNAFASCPVFMKELKIK